MVDLKPCPLCGAAARIVYRNRKCRAECPGCDFRTGLHDLDSEAASVWNILSRPDKRKKPAPGVALTAGKLSILEHMVGHPPMTLGEIAESGGGLGGLQTRLYWMQQMRLLTRTGERGNCRYGLTDKAELLLNEYKRHRREVLRIWKGE